MYYNKQYWANGPAGGTPINAARLTHVEAGIKDLSNVIESGRLSESELSELLSNMTAPVKTFVFTTPSLTWTLPHNLSRPYVMVSCFDLGESEILGDNSFYDDDTAIINWYYPTSGYAVVTF